MPSSVTEVSNVRKYTFYIFLIWVFLSAFYYAGNFISGNVIADSSSDTGFKLLKYAVAAFISVFIFLTLKPQSLLIVYGCLILTLVFLLTFEFTELDVTYARDLTIVFLSFIGFSYLSSKLRLAEINRLVKIIAVSAVLVSIVSIFEYFYMEPILGDYWRQTGGFRSISTLLNPNNLGLYLGAAFIIIIVYDRCGLLFRAFCLPLVFISLLMTGSRTAFVSILFALIFGTVFTTTGTLSKFKIIKWIILSFLMFVLFMFVVGFGFYEFSGRAVDMETADIRIEKYIEYLSGIDFSYLLTDFSLLRSAMVSESSYFHFFNSYGFILGGILISLLLSIYRLPKLIHSSPASNDWIFIVLCIYYIIASLFENVLMSFPNNQLFFIVLGALLSARDRINLPKCTVAQAI